MEFRVALVDDHVLLRGAMAQVLEAAPELPRLQVLQAGSLSKLRARLDGGLTVDLVMLELGLPDLDGLLGLAAFRSSFPTVPVIVMSNHDDAGLVERCALLGAAGFVQKPGSVQQLRLAVGAVLEGDRWLPGDALERASPPRLPVRSML